MSSAIPTGPALFDLTGRTALVTGASRGLRLQMAGALARAGADLVITARKVEDLAAPRAALTPASSPATIVSVAPSERAWPSRPSSRSIAAILGTP